MSRKPYDSAVDSEFNNVHPYGGVLIPQLDSNGLLPEGRHAADLDEIEIVFVHSAPHATVRARIFSAFKLYMDLVKDVVPTGAMWVNGGFCTHKSTPPNDVDIALAVDPVVAQSVDMAKMVPLVTLQGVVIQGVSAGRIQPMGGLVDAFIFTKGDPAQEDYWDALWSTVKGSDGKPVLGVKKGYLEVTW